MGHNLTAPASEGLPFNSQRAILCVAMSVPHGTELQPLNPFVSYALGVVSGFLGSVVLPDWWGRIRARQDAARFFRRNTEGLLTAFVALHTKVENRSTFDSFGPAVLKDDLESIRLGAETFKAASDRLLALRNDDLERKLAAYYSGALSTQQRFFKMASPYWTDPAIAVAARFAPIGPVPFVKFAEDVRTRMVPYTQEMIALLRNQERILPRNRK